jgi:histidine phosphotransferase ChpT
MTSFALDSLDLAALLCSRVCHDVISPVGAIVNGLEVLEEEKDAEMRGIALDLIRKSAETASARLQFCRLAFGAAGSVGASIDTGDAEQVTRGLFADGRTKLEWNGPRILLPKNKVKLILNLCLVAAGAIPRGGIVTVTLAGTEADIKITVSAQGVNAKLPAHVPGLLAGAPESHTVDAQAIQPYYTGLIARAASMDLEVSASSDEIAIAAIPVVVLAEPVAAEMTA